MRKKKLAANTISSFAFQFTTIICGFILPRLILKSFGSEVNGLVNSITQFLGVITFLEMGMGVVVQSSLYKPLADKDNDTVSRIIVSAGRFFKRIGIILICYVAALFAGYPFIANSSFGFLYTGILIVAMSVSLLSQYLFGIVDRLLLTADQRGYIQYTAQTVTLIVNTAACALLIKLGAGIQAVKLTTSLIYLARPVFLRWYVNRHYSLNRQITYTEEPIKQKWNGVAQHIAAVVLDSTDSIVLTILATLSDVSVYNIYHLVVNGVKQLLLATTHGIQALLGELYAKDEREELLSTFAWTEWVIHTGTTFVFGCTASLIVPFVKVYTKGVTDANYVLPVFGLLITLANAIHCLRLPYNLMILAGGHYKQTQHNYIIAALINIIVSVLTVRFYGLVGVAVGTLAAMLYQTVWMAYYNSKHLIKWPFGRFVKQILIDAAVFVTAFLVCKLFKLRFTSYGSWIALAVKDAIVWTVVTTGVNLLLYKKYVMRIFSLVKSLPSLVMKKLGRAESGNAD